MTPRRALALTAAVVCLPLILVGMGLNWLILKLTLAIQRDLEA